MQRFISLIFADGSTLWWCRHQKAFFNPLRNGYRPGAKQPKSDAFPVDDLSIHQRAAEIWVETHIEHRHRPVRLVVHVVKENKNARHK